MNLEVFMLEVQIENIIPVTEARDKFNQIVDAVEGTEELYVLTKNGKPAAIVVGIHHLEKLTGESHTAVFGTENVSAPATAPAEPAETPAPVSPPESETSPPATDFSATAPVAPAAPADGIAYDSVSTTTPPAAPVADSSMPLDSGGTSTPIDSPLIESSATATAGQAIAPDAVTPDQAGPSADPFAIPNEPLDVPEDAQAQSASPTAAPVADDTQTPPSPQV